MISLIVCSRFKTCPDKFRSHIKSTIGDIPHELIWIDNSQNQRNMCQAYNYGVRNARYDYLCFMHEDIVFHTNNWGEMALEDVKEASVGMLGVQGCVYYCESTTYWTKSLFRKAHCVQMRNGIAEKITEMDYPCSNEVVAIDGMWMFVKKDVFLNGIRWDEDSFRHFHMYDMDLSMQLIQKGYKIKILEDLWIEHKSMGNFDISFYEDNKIFHQKWDEHLPVSTIEITKEVQKKSQEAAFKEICRLGKEYALSNKRLSMWPYKIATKICLMFGQEIWK